MSCKKAQEVLGSSSYQQLDVHDAKKEKIDTDDAWNIIKSHERVLIAKGKKILEYAPSQDNKDEILKQAMGRSGNLRAPSLTQNKVLMIGYNEEMYQSLAR